MPIKDKGNLIRFKHLLTVYQTSFVKLELCVPYKKKVSNCLVFYAAPEIFQPNHGESKYVYSINENIIDIMHLS